MSPQDPLGAPDLDPWHDYAGEDCSEARSRMEWGYFSGPQSLDWTWISLCAVRVPCPVQSCVAWLETRF